MLRRRGFSLPVSGGNSVYLELPRLCFLICGARSILDFLRLSLKCEFVWGFCSECTEVECGCKLDAGIQTPGGFLRHLRHELSESCMRESGKPTRKCNTHSSLLFLPFHSQRFCNAIMQDPLSRRLQSSLVREHVKVF